MWGRFQGPRSARGGQAPAASMASILSPERATIGPLSELRSFDDLGGGPAQPTRLNDLPVFGEQRDHGCLCCLFIRALLNSDASALFDKDVPTKYHGTPPGNVLVVSL
jgi:hypothetical protein